MYPAQVKRAMESGEDDDDGSNFDEEVGEIKRILSQPGEIKREFEEFLEKEIQQRRHENKRREEESLRFIEQEFQKETEQTRQEHDDLAFAMALQEKFDKEAQMKNPLTALQERSSRSRRVKVQNYNQFFGQD